MFKITQALLKILKIHHPAIYRPFFFFFSEKQANILILTEGWKFHPPKLNHRSHSPESTRFLMGIKSFQQSSVKDNHQTQTIICILGRI